MPALSLVGLLILLMCTACSTAATASKVSDNSDGNYPKTGHILFGMPTYNRVTHRLRPLPSKDCGTALSRVQAGHPLAWIARPRSTAQKQMTFSVYRLVANGRLPLIFSKVVPALTRGHVLHDSMTSDELTRRGIVGRGVNAPTTYVMVYRSGNDLLAQDDFRIAHKDLQIVYGY